MNFIKETAKAWVGGVGAAITSYLGYWTEDPRIIGLAAIVTALATYFVPNAQPDA